MEESQEMYGSPNTEILKGFLPEASDSTILILPRPAPFYISNPSLEVGSRGTKATSGGRKEHLQGQGSAADCGQQGNGYKSRTSTPEPMLPIMLLPVLSLPMQQGQQHPPHRGLETSPALSQHNLECTQELSSDPR